LALDTGILLGLARLDARRGYVLFPCPVDQSSTDVLRAVVDANGKGLTAPFDNPVQRPGCALICGAGVDGLAAA
jgi:hypothetical protein